MLAKTDIEQYFDAEKVEAIFFICVGILAMATAAGLGIWLKSKWALGCAIPLIIFGILQITVGFSVFRSADKQRTNAVYAYDLDPAYLKQVEVPRMQKVMKNFVYYRYAELAAIVIGMICIVLWKTNISQSWVNGLGWGLALQGLILLGMDFLAEYRGHHYLSGLINWLNK